VEPVGDLFSLRRVLPGRPGAKTAAMSPDHFHLGKSFQPVGAGDHISILENIDDRPTLQIDNDRAKGLRLPPALVVDPDDRGRTGGALSTLIPSELSRVRTVAQLRLRQSRLKCEATDANFVASNRCRERLPHFARFLRMARNDGPDARARQGRTVIQQGGNMNNRILRSRLLGSTAAFSIFLGTISPVTLAAQTAQGNAERPDRLTRENCRNEDESACSTAEFREQRRLLQERRAQRAQALEEAAKDAEGTSPDIETTPDPAPTPEPLQVPPPHPPSNRPKPLWRCLRQTLRLPQDPAISL
jgi:hypothetical protein